MENQIPQRKMPLNEKKGECDRSKSIAPSPTSPNSTLRTPLRYPNKPTASVFLNTTRRRILLAHAEKPAQKNALPSPAPPLTSLTFMRNCNLFSHKKLVIDKIY